MPQRTVACRRWVNNLARGWVNYLAQIPLAWVNNLAQGWVNYLAQTAFSWLVCLAHDNRNSFAWTDVELAVNAGLLTRGYFYRASRVEAGKTYRIGAAQFAKSDGTRFNPLAVKPQSLTITCDQGFWTGDWE